MMHISAVTIDFAQMLRFEIRAVSYSRHTSTPTLDTRYAIRQSKYYSLNLMESPWPPSKRLILKQVQSRAQESGQAVHRTASDGL